MKLFNIFLGDVDNSSWSATLGLQSYSTTSRGSVDSRWSLELSGICYSVISLQFYSGFIKLFNFFLGRRRQQLVLGTVWDLFLYEIFHEFYIGLLRLFNLCLGSCQQQLVLGTFSDLLLYGIPLQFYTGFIRLINSFFFFFFFFGGCRQQLVLGTFWDLFLYGIPLQFYIGFIKLFNLFLGGCRRQLVLGTFWGLFLHDIFLKFYNGFIKLFNLFLEELLTAVSPWNFLGSVPLCNFPTILQWFWNYATSSSGAADSSWSLELSRICSFMEFPCDSTLFLYCYSTSSWEAVDSSWSLELSGICSFMAFSFSFTIVPYDYSTSSWWNCWQQLVLGTFWDLFLYVIFFEFDTGLKKNYSTSSWGAVDSSRSFDLSWICSFIAFPLSSIMVL